MQLAEGVAVRSSQGSWRSGGPRGWREQEIENPSLLRKGRRRRGGWIRRRGWFWRGTKSESAALKVGVEIIGDGRVRGGIVRVGGSFGSCSGSVFDG